VPDLRAIDFFGSPAFTALYYNSVRCARSDVDWMIVGSPPVRRVLSICDPEGELPLVDDRPLAIERLDRLVQRCYHVAPAGWPPAGPRPDRIEVPCGGSSRLVLGGNKSATWRRCHVVDTYREERRMATD
jgi:hypothetical protein